jgi:hypothetical protein
MEATLQAKKVVVIERKYGRCGYSPSWGD